jgi:RNA polymerase sigma-70 factor (ECF subfamily)
MGGMEATVLTDTEDLKKIRKSIYGYLTMTQREYLHLRNDEGKTLDEIAEITGKPKTSIKSTLSSARKQMLNLIKNQL